MAGSRILNTARTGNNPFLRGVAMISTFAGWCAATMIILAVGLTCKMIFIRFVLNGSTVWQTEAVIYMMIAATLIGLPYVQHLRGHVNVDLIPLSLAARPRFILAIVVSVLSIAIVAVMLWYGFEIWHRALTKNWRSATIWGVPLWIPYLSIPIGFALLLLQLVADFVALVTRTENPFGIDDADAQEKSTGHNKTGGA